MRFVQILAAVLGLALLSGCAGTFGEVSGSNERTRASVGLGF